MSAGIVDRRSTESKIILVTGRIPTSSRRFESRDHCHFVGISAQQNARAWHVRGREKSSSPLVRLSSVLVAEHLTKDRDRESAVRPRRSCRWAGSGPIVSSPGPPKNSVRFWGTNWGTNWPFFAVFGRLQMYSNGRNRLKSVERWRELAFF